MNSFFQIKPSGSDLNPAGPWGTLAGARDALRGLRASGKLTGTAHVEIGGGTYPLAETVLFFPEDGETRYVAASGSKPVFDGAKRLAGWRETSREGLRLWTLDLPEVASGHWYFRSLFVQGERRPRARFPKFSPDREGVKKTFRIGEMRFPERRGLFEGDNLFKPLPGDMENWPSLWDAEIVLLHYWVETRLPSPRLDPATGWVRCARRSVFNLYESFKEKLARYYIDNLYEALTEPGEWYLDRTTGRLSYLPLPGETIEGTPIAAPLLTAFVEARGHAFNRMGPVNDPVGARPVEGLHFEGLTFRHADWYQPQAGLLPHDLDVVREIPLGSAPQAAAHVPAAITFRWARKCRVDGCAVERTGFTALEFGPGCRDCEASRNTFRHLGGGGVKLGGSELDGPPADRVGHIRIVDNRIVHIGQVFHQSVGILLTHAFECDLLHNEIGHTCYTGISCGWSWGYRETITRDIRIEGNLIHDICEGVLSDNGGIYLLGVQPGTVVRHNHISRVTAADYGGWGIYPDEGSSHLVIENNWVHDIQGPCLFIHFGRELVIRNNVFARSRLDSLIAINRIESHVAATLLHNLFLGPAPLLYQGGYAGDIRKAFHTDANLLWFPGGIVPESGHLEDRTDVPRRISWQEWQECGHDRRTVVADPGMRESAVTCTFPPDSPVWKLGFRPVDWTGCGPRAED